MLGIWLAKTPLETATAGEGARFWASVTADLRNRGVRDILIAGRDGLAGFEDAIHAAFPHTVVQTCVVHLIRNSLRPVARRDAAAVAAGLRTIYTAADPDAAFDALAAFSASPIGQKYPQAVKVWENAWQVHPVPGLHPTVRKLLYTTNSIESLNYQLRKVTKARGHFPGDDAVVKLLWLAIINIEDKRARERAARRQETGKRSDQPARLIEGQRVMGWREALNERHRLPRTNQVRAETSPILKDLYTPEFARRRRGSPSCLRQRSGAPEGSGRFRARQWRNS